MDKQLVHKMENLEDRISEEPPTGMRYYVYSQVPFSGKLMAPYLAGTSNNKRLAIGMCEFLCRENPVCIAWIVNPGDDPMSVNAHARHYFSNKAKKETERGM